MAKYYSSTFGKISGKHGNAVAVIRKDGSTYLRLHVPSSNPRTDKQQAHRAKFALTSKSLVPFNPIFKETIGITNGISTARSYAFKNAIVGEYPNLSVDYEKLMFSFGVLEKLHNSSVVINEGVMTIMWGYNKMYNCHKNDSVNFVVFNKDTNQSIHLRDVGVRADKEAKIEVHDSWTDCELYLWAYLTRDGKFSDSVFVSAEVGSNISECSDRQVDRCDNGMAFDNTYTYSSLSFGIKQYVASFIIMICNLAKLFNPSSIYIKAHRSLNLLVHRSLYLDKGYDDTCIYVERVAIPRMHSYLSNLFKVQYGNNNKVYPSIPIYYCSIGSKLIRYGPF